MKALKYKGYKIEVVQAPAFELSDDDDDDYEDASYIHACDRMIFMAESEAGLSFALDVEKAIDGAKHLIDNLYKS